MNIPADVNGCKYRFKLNSTNPIDIVWPAGEKVVITAFNCWTEVGPQELSGTVTYANTGSGTSRDIDVSGGLTGIAYTLVSKSFPGCSNGSFSNGTYTGNATVKGFNGLGTQVGIWKE